MDHQEAVRLRATERYVLGELSPEEREQFEEHYFECTECASDVKALVTFVTGSRKVLEEQSKAEGALRVKKTERRSRLSWLRPAIAIPTFAALAAIVIFQSVVTSPALKKLTGSTQVAQVYKTSFRLQGATRGEGVSRVAIRPEENFVLDFDFTPQRTFAGYQGSLIDSAGVSVLTFQLKKEEANRELHLLVPGGRVRAGSYNLVLFGQNDAANANARKEEVQRISFVVEVSPE